MRRRLECKTDGAPVPQSLSAAADHMQYMNGYADGTFRPDIPIIRAEACKLIASPPDHKAANGGSSVHGWTFRVVRRTWCARWLWLRPGRCLRTARVPAGHGDYPRGVRHHPRARFPHDDIGTGGVVDVPASHWAHGAVRTARWRRAGSPATRPACSGGRPDHPRKPSPSSTACWAVRATR